MLMQADGIKVPTIVMAGFDDFDANEFDGFESVVKYLHKPFEIADVISAVQEHAAE